jgi:ferredoxin
VRSRSPSRSPRIITEKCKACGKCAEVCPYNAITVDVKAKKPAVVNSAACAGCGTCAAECPFGAISMNHFTDAQILGQVDAMLETGRDKILAFACNWCSYAGADYAGVSRLQYPPNVRLIRTMCSGRVDEKFIWQGLPQGRAGDPGERLPHRRLPLHRCQPLDGQAGRKGPQEDGKDRHPARTAAAGMDQRRRGYPLRRDHEADGDAAPQRHRRGDRPSDFIISTEGRDLVFNDFGGTVIPAFQAGIPDIAISTRTIPCGCQTVPQALHSYNLETVQPDHGPGGWFYNRSNPW